MSGAAVAAASGIGFGLFQTLNVRAVRGMDPFASTFVQIAVAAVALLVASGLSGGLAELDGAPAGALAYFAAAGVLHFVAGWTLLNVSQKRIGAARTSPLLTTVPLFGIAIAALTVGQLPEAVEVPAIALIVAGAYVVVSRGAGGRHTRLADALPALACALCWALSPALTVRGLDRLDDPLVGLTLGLCVSVVGYLLAFAVWRPAISGEASSTTGIDRRFSASTTATVVPSSAAQRPHVDSPTRTPASSLIARAERPAVSRPMPRRHTANASR